MENLSRSNEGLCRGDRRVSGRASSEGPVAGGLPGQVANSRGKSRSRGDAGLERDGGDIREPSPPLCRCQSAVSRGAKWLAFGWQRQPRKEIDRKIADTTIHHGNLSERHCQLTGRRFSSEPSAAPPTIPQPLPPRLPEVGDPPYTRSAPSVPERHRTVAGPGPGEPFDRCARAA